MGRELRVVVVDDNVRLRQVLSAHLADLAGLQVVRTFATARALLDFLAQESPDVIVLDNQMPGGDGVDALPDVRRACPAARIVLWTSDPRVEALALARGADAVVDKGTSLDAVGDAALG